MKLSGNLDKFKADPEDYENHIAIQKEMIKLYRKVINNKKSTHLFDELDYVNVTDAWIDYTKTNNPHLKQLTGKEMIKRIRTTLKMWEDYGHNYLVGDPRDRFFTIPLKKAIEEENLPKIKEFIDMGNRLSIIESEDDDKSYDKKQKGIIRKLLDDGDALLDGKENRQPKKKKRRSHKGGKSKSKRKKAKGQGEKGTQKRCK